MALQGRPLDPSLGFAGWGYNANVGLGDLLVFCLYATAAYRGSVAAVRSPRSASSPSSARSPPPDAAPGAGTVRQHRGRLRADHDAVRSRRLRVLPVAVTQLPERPLPRLAWRSGGTAGRRCSRGGRFGRPASRRDVALVVATAAAVGDTTPTNAAAPPPDIATTAGRRERRRPVRVTCATSGSAPPTSRPGRDRRSPGPTRIVSRTTSWRQRAQTLTQAISPPAATFTFRATAPGAIDLRLHTCTKA